MAEEQIAAEPRADGRPAAPAGPARSWLPRLRLRGVGLRTSERTLLLMLADLVVVVAALLLAIKTGTDWLDPPGAVWALWWWWTARTAPPAP